jgi:Ca2+-binding EF-hand superfamily protein
MASDKDKKELVQKVSELVRNRYGGSYESAFRHYSRSKSQDDTVDSGELRELLSDAAVGNGITRGAWASGIIGELDKDGDGRISWREFETVVKR